jgi:hypothetical protein
MVQNAGKERKRLGALKSISNTGPAAWKCSEFLIIASLFLL